MVSLETGTGISLFPWEVSFFPEKQIRPCLGLGTKPGHSDFKVLLYTYEEKTCYHLKDNICSIYVVRPLVCKSYPFRIKRQGGKNIYVVAPECSTIKNWPNKKTTHHHFDEMDAAELIGDYLNRFYKANESRWRFILGKGWIRIGNK
jgi:Fe-S-cluster containining protein